MQMRARGRPSGEFREPEAGPESQAEDHVVVGLGFVRGREDACCSAAVSVGGLRWGMEQGCDGGRKSRLNRLSNVSQGSFSASSAASDPGAGGLGIETILGAVRPAAFKS